MKNKVWIILLLMILLSSVFMGCMLPPAHTHSYSEWTVVKEATCTEAGLQEQVCSCGDKVSAPISATGHTIGEWVVDSELSCTTDLVKNQSCTVCGEIVNTESTQATGHIFTDWSTVTESTCTQNGQQQRACTVCGEIETKDIELLEHSFGEWTVVEQSTCTQQGLEERACVCGEKETRDIELKPHSEGQWITDSQPNCTQDGSKHQVCAVCGSTIKTESIDALGHNYTSVVTPPTCEEQGYTTHTCSVCSDSYIDTYVDATDHTKGEWIVDIEPDCTTEGSKHQVCFICGDTIKTEPIDVTGHSHEAVVTDPTCLEQGYTTHTCHCGDSYVDTYVDALGHNFQESDTCSICGQNIADAAVVTIDMSATADDNVTGYVVSRMDDKYDAYIKGVGAMKDYSDSPFAIDGYAIVDAYIDSGVTSIGAFAFYECFNLAEISFPNSVTSVGMFAFSNCGQLTSIVIPQSLISIEYYAFHGSGLSNITIEGTPQIGSFAFTYTPYYIDASNWQDDVLYVGHCLIAAKTTIEVCTIRQGTTVIADGAFRSCANIQSITIPSSITKVSNWAFGSCSNLTSVTIPNSVTSIGAFAFYECSNLTGITIPESVTSIGDEAFRYCTGLTSITIPSNVTSIGFAAFDGCTSLTTVYYSGTEEQWNSISIDIGTGCLTNANIVFNHPDHNYIAVVTPPTCTEQGYTTHTCHCGDSFVDTYVDVLGHTISSWDIVDESVSVEDRLFAGTCEICQSVEEISLQQRFAQLEYVSFGDSITYGIDGVDWGLMEDPYPELVSNALGFKSFSNLAVSGATFCQNTLNRTNMTQKILSFTGKADIISLMLGVNDCYVGLPLGTSESRDNTTIYGSLFLISEYLTNNYSDSFVFYMTPFPAKSCYEDNSIGYNLEDVANAIKHVAARYDIPVLDMFLYSEYENVEMDNPNGDGLHPSQSFMRDYAAPKIISFIKDNYGVNYIHSHTIEVDQEIAPTCTNTGLTEGKHCDVCGEVLIAQEVVDALGHDEIEHEAKAPTCTEIGWDAYVTCSRCDYTTYNEISAMGHYHEVLVVHPTCAVQGYTYHECHCGDSYIDSITDPAGHKFIKGICNVCGEWDSFGLILTLSEDKTSYIVSAIGTCTEIDLVIPACHDGKQVTGIDSHALQNYEKLRSVIIPRTITCIGENAFKDCTSLEIVIFQSATEIKSIGRGAFKGCISLTKVSYPRTQENWNKITIDLENSCLTNSTFLFNHSIHSYEPVVTAPTCTNQGYTTYTCTCGLCYVDIYVDALGHDEIEHEAQAPTCTEIGWDAYVTCSRCDFTTKQIIPAIGHSYKSVVTDPTCIEQGYTTHTCICGDSFMDTYVDANGHDEISHDAQTATCTEIGWDEYVTCSNCDYTTYVEVPATDHDYKSVVTAPSCSSRGYTTYTCVNCEYSYKGTYVDALDHNFENDICTVCGAEIGSEGLAFSLSEDGAYYIVSGIGTCIDTNIKIPSTYNGRSVRGIAAYAFEYGDITSVKIASSITYIGDVAFRSCRELTEVTFAKNSQLVSIGDGAFNFTNISNIVLPDSLKTIEVSAFNGSGLTSITIPNGVTSIADKTFYGCVSLKDVIIPNSVTSIGNSVFYWCESLTNISIPSSVTTIGERAFCKSGITSINIPYSITSIGVDAFDSCSSLTNINVDENNTNYKSLDGNLYSKDGTMFIQYAIGKTERAFTIQSDVTSIGRHAFHMCPSLTNITIPEGVISIDIGAFSSCIGLTSIVIPNGVTSIENSTFEGCNSLTSITIPSSVTSIGANAFQYCSSLTNITIPNSVIYMGKNVFNSCGGLASITLSESLTSIESDTFYSCTNLTSIIIPVNVTIIDNYAFMWCTNLTIITIPESVTSIGKKAFYHCDSITTVYFAGEEARWNDITIGSNNGCLTNANIVYNYTTAESN